MNLAPRNHKDVLAGAVFFMVGAGIVAASAGVPSVGLAGYAVGSARRMGPGYFPVMLGGLLMLVGAAVIGSAWRTQPMRLDSIALRPVLVIASGVAVFGVLMKTIGLVVAVAMLVVFSAFGGRDFRWREVALMALLLALGAAVIFVGALKLPLPVWPASAP